MLVFVVDNNGMPGHPTRRLDWVRKCLRRKRARLIGGGVSGKPPVLVLQGQTFDPEATVERRFVIALDTGFRHIGFVVAEVLGNGTLRVLLMGTLMARTPDIRGLMDERRTYRRFRRYLRRARTKKGTPKQRPPRYESRRKRPPVTHRHGMQAHLSLFAKLAKLAPLPPNQTERGFEDIAFDLRALIYGKPSNGRDYQISPQGMRNGEKTRAFVLRRDGGCLICGTKEGLHTHHLRKRSKRGSNRAANQVALCERCHTDVHAGLIALPINDGATWRDAGNVNAVVGMLREIAENERLIPIPVEDVVNIRSALNLPKAHDWDAIAGALALTGATSIDDTWAWRLELKQYRRHRRAHIHAQRDRLYYRDGKIVARNRRKRCDQTQDSLTDLRAKDAATSGRLIVKPSRRIYTPDRNAAPAVSGEIWTINGRRFVVDGLQGGGRYLHSHQLEALVGKTWAPVAKCRRVLGNEGIVVASATPPNGVTRRGLSLPGLNAGVPRARR